MSSLQLDSNTNLPLHQQVEQLLREQISSGQWPAGSMIPSERELMRSLDVSRATVRQAIGSLITQGLLRRVHGRGTFVAQTRLEQPIGTLYSFADQIASLGRSLEDRIVQRRSIEAPADLAQALGIDSKESLIHIQRLRILEGTPFTLDNFYLPERLCPDLLHDPIDGSLYRILSERYDLPPLRASETLEVASADRALAFYLNVSVGTPLMFIERISYTRNDLPLHVGRNYIRGDMCRFHVDLWRKPAAIELKSL